MAPLIVGGLIWLPALFLVSIVRGPWFIGSEFLGAIGPVVAFSVPGAWAIYRGRRATGLPWAVAFAPLLLVVGSLSMYSVKQAIYGNVHDPAEHTVAPLVTLAGWCCFGVLLTLLGSLGAERRTDIDQPTADSPEVDVDPAVIDQIVERLREQGCEVRAISPRSWVVLNKVRTLERYFYTPEEFIQWAMVSAEAHDQPTHENSSSF